MTYATSKIALPGSRIQLRDKTYTVVKINPKNLVITDADGNRFNLNRSAKYTIIEDDVSETRKTPVVTMPVAMWPGTVVRVKSEHRAGLGTKFSYLVNQAFVVIKDNVDRVNVVKMGGEGGRYWRIPKSWLEIVEIN